MARIEASNEIERITTNSLTIYTDGSKINEKVGAGFHIPHLNHSKSFRLTDGASIFTAELTAILMALEYAPTTPHTSISILSDSLSALQAIKGGECCRDDIAEEILHKCSEWKQRGRSVQMIWIPSHIGIQGNEYADKAAKKGVESRAIVKTGIGYSEMKATIKKQIKEEWIQKWNASDKGRHAHNILRPPDGRLQVTEDQRPPINKKITRLRLGSASFIHTKKWCHTCNEINTIDHYLIHCKAYNNQRKELINYFQINKNTLLTTETLLAMDAPSTLLSLVKKYVHKTEESV
ncbi:uncharacterized protein LOC131936811 [Physella acuta]|uniref:uncharacterized protein LOC131936811 n=1 Tax=Physella acuta TaxID=109671 RepID=UPI0027DC0E0F|nr:uncharacterized protein LOC131936811 [Physella acuta]